MQYFRISSQTKMALAKFTEVRNASGVLQKLKGKLSGNLECNATLCGEQVYLHISDAKQAFKNGKYNRENTKQVSLNQQDVIILKGLMIGIEDKFQQMINGRIQERQQQQSGQRRNAPAQNQQQSAPAQNQQAYINPPQQQGQNMTVQTTPYNPQYPGQQNTIGTYHVGQQNMTAQAYQATPYNNPPQQQGQNMAAKNHQAYSNLPQQQGQNMAVQNMQAYNPQYPRQENTIGTYCQTVTQPDNSMVPLYYQHQQNGDYTDTTTTVPQTVTAAPQTVAGRKRQGAANAGDNTTSKAARIEAAPTTNEQFSVIPVRTEQFDELPLFQYI